MYAEVTAFITERVPWEVYVGPVDADVTVAMVGFGSAGVPAAGAVVVKVSVSLSGKFSHGANYSSVYAVAD